MPLRLSVRTTLPPRRANADWIEWHSRAVFARPNCQTAARWCWFRQAVAEETKARGSIHALSPLHLFVSTLYSLGKIADLERPRRHPQKGRQVLGADLNCSES